MKAFTILAAALTLTHAAFAAGTVVKASIEGMHCDSCVHSIEAKLKKVPNVVGVSVKITDAEHENGEAVVTMKDGAKVDAEAIKAAVADAGYEVKKLQ